MTGKRNIDAQIAEITQRLKVMKDSYYAEVNSVQELSKENERLDEICVKLSRGNKSLRHSLEMRDQEIKKIKRRTTYEQPTTFMDMPIADAVAAMLVAEELARAVKKKYSPLSHLNEIANRFLKLRDPRPALNRVTYRCPECGGKARKTGDKVEDPEFWCPNHDCNWRGEA